MVVKSRCIPVPGETILGGDFMMNPGGKGANQAVAAARLGGDVSFIVKIGNDVFGKQALDLWKKEKIDTSFAIIDKTASSGVALIMVDSHGENCISVASGANAALLPDDILPAKNMIESADILLMQLEIPTETVCCATQWAAQKGIPVILNPAPATNLPSDIYRKINIITPNETETEILTGIHVSDEKSLSEASHCLLDRGVKNVIITLGKRGTYVSSPEFTGFVSAPIVEAVDTTAAGDVFNGALSVALSEKMSLLQAVHFASQAAAISVTRCGAQTSAPYRNEL